MKNEIIIFENQEVKLEVNVKDETVWLSLEQVSKLFDRDRTVITRHINNIFKEKELYKEEVCAKFAHTTAHGALSDKTQTRKGNNNRFSYELFSRLISVFLTNHEVFDSIYESKRQIYYMKKRFYK